MILNGTTSNEMELPDSYILITVVENIYSTTRRVLVNDRCVGILISPVCNGVEVFYPNVTC